MPVHLTILGSGSSGNCAYVETAETRLRIDAGLSLRQIRTDNNELIIIDAGTGIFPLSQALLAELPVTANVLITHSHWDHIQGLPFFTKAFVDYDAVTLKTDTTGVNLPQNADIKLRGVIVGEVRKVEPDGSNVKLLLAMNPKLIKDVPKEVTAQLIPKTLFGEKYVSLIPPTDPSGQHLKAGDTITKADVPIEVETLLNDLYPLLDAVDPANLSYTLSAVSSALEGRGTQLGDTLVQANSLLQKTNPDVPELVDDLIKLGTVADGYADAMPALGDLLRNTVTTSNTAPSSPCPTFDTS